MTAARKAEKREQSCIENFYIRPSEEINSMANDLSMVLRLVHYKDFDTSILVQNMCEQLSRIEDLTSTEGRDLLHLATTDLITILRRKIQFYSTLLEQCEVNMNLTMKGNRND